jgi:hypothetical protein
MRISLSAKAQNLFAQLDALNLCGTAKRSSAAAPQIVENAAVAS